MPVFTNKSSQVFQDDDLIVLLGEKFATDDEGRMRQTRELYKWQFDKTASAKDAPSKDVRELRDIGYVQLDENGTQAELVGDASTSKK